MEIVVLKSAFFLLMLCVYIVEVDGLFLNNLSNDIRIQRKSPEDVDNGECVLKSMCAGDDNYNLILNPVEAVL